MSPSQIQTPRLMKIYFGFSAVLGLSGVLGGLAIMHERTLPIPVVKGLKDSSGTHRVRLSSVGLVSRMNNSLYVKNVKVSYHPDADMTQTAGLKVCPHVFWDEHDKIYKDDKVYKCEEAKDEKAVIIMSHYLNPVSILNFSDNDLVRWDPTLGTAGIPRIPRMNIQITTQVGTNRLYGFLTTRNHKLEVDETNFIHPSFINEGNHLSEK